MPPIEPPDTSRSGLWGRVAAPWQRCLEEAWAGYVSGCHPIAAAVVDAAGRVLVMGRNRIYERGPLPGQLAGNPLAHAEVNALAQLAHDTDGLRACVLYTTTEPCPFCIGALYMSGVRGLRYASRDAWAGSVDLLGATPYMRRKAISVCGPESPELEEVLVALRTANHLRLSADRAQPSLELTRAICPAGVAAGEALFQSGGLARRAAEGAPVAAVVDAIAALVRECGPAAMR